MSLALLADLSLRGSLVLVAVFFADQFLARKMTTRWRKVWWLLVPLAFLFPATSTLSWPAYFTSPLVSPSSNETYPSPLSGTSAPIDSHTHFSLAALTAIWNSIPAGPLAGLAFSWIELVWLTGAVASALFVIVPTWKATRQWSGKRLSTDPGLLNLLEDAKAAAGVTAPIGLVVADQLAAPALFGWLRPRILLPTHLAASPPQELQAVFLHELAHFKSLDIPLNWLFAAIRIVHWFNPLAWLATSCWMRFREEAADENAIRWMHEPGGTVYGEILLKTLGKCTGGSAPYGALAIGESIENLKRRMLMIRNYNSTSNRSWMASIVILALGALMALSPVLAATADDQDAAKQEATAAMQTWLGEMDAADYAKSWSDSAKSFQKAIASEKWVAVSTQVRNPLGKLLSRKLDSALYQVGINQPNAKPLKGTYVVAQFDTSFENLKYARETVTFEKESDGSWRAAGYYIKPQ